MNSNEKDNNREETCITCGKDICPFVGTGSEGGVNKNNRCWIKKETWQK